MKKLIFNIMLCCGPLAHAALSLDTYSSIGSESAPYSISLVSKAGQMLEYIGTCHTSDPHHAQYSTIKKRWAHFLKHTDSKKITVIETVFPASYSSESAALNAGNDSGFASWLSQSHQVPIIGAELTHNNVIQKVIQQFGKEQGYYFAFAQALSFYGQINPNLSYEQYAVSKVQEWTGDTSITFEQLKKIHESFTGSPFSYNKSYFFNLMNISYHNSFILKACTFSVPSAVATKFFPLLRHSHFVRDSHTLGIISNQWNQGKNIFIVYGAMHAAALKKALQKLVTK